MRWGLALAVTALVTVVAFGVEARTDATAGDVIGPGTVTVTLDIEHSRFSPSELRVHAGTLVRFVVRNGDPIHHEFVVGPAEVHRLHEHGTERRHPPVPGEVSVGPNATGMTIYRFDEPGNIEFACHLPGHVAYGMVGTIEVVAAPGVEGLQWGSPAPGNR